MVVFNGAGNVRGGDQNLMFQIPMLAVTVIASSGWIIPLILQTAQRFSDERQSGNWDLILVTPQPTYDILIAFTAGGIRWIWRSVLSLVLFATLLGICLFTILCLTGGQDFGLTLILMTIGIAALVIERTQEIALAVLIGQAIGLYAQSRNAVLLTSFIVGLLLRFIQVFFLLIVMQNAPTVVETNVAWLNAVAGSSLALLASPFNVLYLVGLIALREALAYILSTWITFRAAYGEIVL
jgi:hypothetical protein